VVIIGLLTRERLSILIPKGKTEFKEPEKLYNYHKYKCLYLFFGVVEVR